MKRDFIAKMIDKIFEGIKHKNDQYTRKDILNAFEYVASHNRKEGCFIMRDIIFSTFRNESRKLYNYTFIFDNTIVEFYTNSGNINRVIIYLTHLKRS